MDLTNDGIADIISGSYPGEIYLFAGKEDGTYSKSVVIKDKHGKDINIGRAAAVCVADWDRDGDLDLVIGNIDGKVCFITNEGDEGRAIFGDPVWLEATGQAIKAPGRNAGPAVADWDRDGHPDLVVGCGDGSVLFFRNTTAQGMPVLAAGVELLASTRNFGARRAKNTPPKISERGYRAKVYVADWNEDGRLDILVGDFDSRIGKAPTLTEEQKADRDRLKIEQKAISKNFMDIYRKLQAKFEAEHGFSLRNAPKDRRPELRKSWMKLTRQDQDYSRISRKRAEVSRKLRAYLPPRTTHGHVWAYLRK